MSLSSSTSRQSIVALELCAVLLLIASCVCLAVSVHHTFLFTLNLTVAGLILGHFAQHSCVNPQTDQAWTLPGTMNGHVLRVVGNDSTSEHCLIDGTVMIQGVGVHRSRVLLSVFSPVHVRACEVQIFRVTARFKLPQPRQVLAEFDDQQYCAAQGVRWRAQCSGDELSLLSRPTSWRTIIADARTALLTLIDELYWVEDRGLVRALVLGETSEIDPDVLDAYARSGTTHVLAVSGLHIALVSAILIALVAAILNPLLRITLVFIVISAYVLVCGSEPSALRAEIMMLGLMMSRIVQRPLRLLNTLSFSAIILLLFEPECVRSVSAQLSFTAVAGIACFYQPLESLLRRVHRSDHPAVTMLRRSMCLSQSAGMISGPLVAWMFAMTSIVSPLANIVVVPLSSIAAISAMLSMLVAPIWHSFAHTVAALTSVLLQLTTSACELTANAPFAVIGGTPAIVFSISMSFAFLYLIGSTVRRQFMTRCFYTAVIVVAVYGLAGARVTTQTLLRYSFSARLETSASGAALLQLYRRDSQRIANNDATLAKMLRHSGTHRCFVDVSPSASIDAFKPLISSLEFELSPCQVVVLTHD